MIKLTPKVDSKLLYGQFFALGNQSVKENWDSKGNKGGIEKLFWLILIKAKI